MVECKLVFGIIIHLSLKFSITYGGSIVLDE